MTEQDDDEQRFFATGTCACGNKIAWGATPIYKIGFRVAEGTGQIWEWFCPHCGRIYQEKAKIIKLKYAKT